MGRNAYLSSRIKALLFLGQVYGGAEISGGELGRSKLFIMWGARDRERDL